MVQLALDTIIFARLGTTDDEDLNDHYIRLLTDLQRIRQSSSVQLLASADAWRALNEADVPIPWEQIYSSERDIVALSLRLLDRTLSIENWLGIEDVLISASRARPDDHLDGRSSRLTEDYHQVCGLIAFGYALCESRTSAIPILTRGLATVEKVAVSGRIDAIVPDHPTTPYSYDHEVAHLPSLDYLPQAFDPCELWIDTEYRHAIILEIIQTSVRPWMEWIEGDFPFVIREEFIDSLGEHGFDRIETRVQRIVRECANIVLKRNLRDTRHLRVGEGPESPQRERDSDGAVAWRRDVDDEYRIHYWQIGDTFELAHLASHNEFTIPE